MARAWSPVQIDGLIVLFTGHIANARALAGELGLTLPQHPGPDDLARLYAKLVRRYGSGADLQAIGEYAAGVIEPERRTLRLVRSPLRAPPLHYYHDAGRIIAASVPRVILAAGVKPRLNPLRMADNAWFNYGTDQSGWYAGIERLPPGHALEAGPDGVRLNRYYEPADLPQIRLPRRSDYVEQAQVLLTEAVAAALDGYDRPGSLLTGGLDSSIVTATALDVLPEAQQLPTFTSIPQQEWDGRVPAGTYGNERPWVEAFAQRHPRIRPQFFENAGLGFDHGLAELFQLIGIAPINLSNFSHYHEPFRAARAAGCDVVLMAEWGNQTFSNGANWAAREYFRTRRWGELTALLRADEDDRRPLWRRFAGECLLPALPAALWRWQRAIRGVPDAREIASPLRGEFVKAHFLAARGHAQSGGLAGAAPASQRAWLLSELSPAFDETNDIWQGFEQLYGVAIRDPAAYRPLAEFCFGLPTDLYAFQGQRRWLAREMAHGMLPEAQRRNPRRGRHHADWLAKLAPRRAELRAELERLEQVPELAEMMDFPRLKAALDDWPGETPVGADALSLQVAVTRGLTTARFINYVAGRNC